MVWVAEEAEFLPGFGTFWRPLWWLAGFNFGSWKPSWGLLVSDYLEAVFDVLDVFVVPPT